MNSAQRKTFIDKRLAVGLQDIQAGRVCSFADLFGAVKNTEKPKRKRLRKEFEQHVAKKKN